jgi:hypothetical protein
MPYLALFELFRLALMPCTLIVIYIYILTLLLRKLLYIKYIEHSLLFIALLNHVLFL